MRLRGNVFLVHVDGDVFKLSVGKGFEDLETKETSVFLRRSRDQSGVMLWELCNETQAEDATEKKEKRKTPTQGKPFIPYDRLLTLFKPTEKYSPEKIDELVKKYLDRGVNWATSAKKQLWLEKKLAKSEKKNEKGQAFVFYYLPTALEPATGLPTDQDD